MLADLDRTLEELLRRELPPELVSQVAITFATPDAQFPPASVTLPAIDLFLYDLRENRGLRSTEWLVERHADGTATRQRPPARVDCSYLVTAWASDSTTTPTQDEHRILGEVMRVLLAHPTIPAEALQGDLRGQEPPLPASSLQPGHLQSIAEFWQALGGRPRAALSYTVTIGVEALRPVETGPLVTDKLLRFRLEVQEG
ncbi:MAG: DUF4255 domain-containing protein [Chloroflexota bacterium]|nr:DUF4255 domain-containing protein [Chloroflexota bacterium]